MPLSTQIKPISYIKANAAEIMKTIEERREPIIVTQNGEAKAVLQDIKSYEQTLETLALLKILALGNRQVEQNRTTPAGKLFAEIRTGRQDEI